MSNPTTPFSWQMPTATDLVTDLPADFEVFGQAVATSMGDLLGGTTGQVLAKTSGTDMDFTWTTTADVTPLTTKGDLFTFTTVDARLAVGTNGQTLVADSAEATGLKWATASSTAVNKNYLINGGFAIAQRGTSFTASDNNDDAYTLDRFYILSDGNDIIDVTQNTSTVPTNGQFSLALDVETINKKFGIATIIENKDCIGLIGNTVTFSFKAKVSATTQLDNVKCAIVAWSGTADAVTSDIISAWGVEGTDPTLIANATYENTPTNLNLTTSYASYSVSAAVDTASTKNIILFIWSDVTTTTLGDFLFIAESKLELGSSASAFEYAGGTIQGETSACQRYFQTFKNGAVGVASSTTNWRMCLVYPVQMRTAPSCAATAAIRISDIISSAYTQSSANITVGELTVEGGTFDLANFTGMTSGRFATLVFISSGTIQLSAEL